MLKSMIVCCPVMLDHDRDWAKHGKDIWVCSNEAHGIFKFACMKWIQGREDGNQNEFAHEKGVQMWVCSRLKMG